MPEAALLHCPTRGNLRVPQRAADQLTFTEEKQRIDAIRCLIQSQYPKEHFGVETTLFRIGNAGRNSFRTDFAIHDQPLEDIRGFSLERRLDHVRLPAEIERDNRTSEEANCRSNQWFRSPAFDSRLAGFGWSFSTKPAQFLKKNVLGNAIAGQIVRPATISRLKLR